MSLPYGLLGRIRDLESKTSTGEGYEAKTTVADDDGFIISDSADSNLLKKLSWTNLKAAILSWFSSVTATLSNKTLTSPTINGGTMGSTTPITSFRADAAGIGTAVDSNYSMSVAGQGLAKGVNIANVTVGRSGGDYGGIGYNFRTTASGGSYTYNVTDNASLLRFHAGGFRFYTAPSGTAGNAITFTLAAELTEAGVFSVGGNPVSTNSTSSTHTVQQIELGHASDTTVTRPGPGRMQIEGKEVARFYTGSFTTASLAAGATETETITHGLGTDNVMVTIMGEGDTDSSQWHAVAYRPDGKHIGFPGAGGFSSLTTTTPSSGDVAIVVRNSDGASQTVSITYMITALD